MLFALLIFCGRLWYWHSETGKANRTSTLIVQYQEILYPAASITDNDTGSHRAAEPVSNPGFYWLLVNQSPAAL